MAADEWDEVDEAFTRLERYRVLHPTLTAMRKLVPLVRGDEAFADVHPRVSHVSIVFSRGRAKRRVYAGWTEDDEYTVGFIDPEFELSEVTMVREDAVVRVLRAYLDRLGDSPREQDRR